MGETGLCLAPMGAVSCDPGAQKPAVLLEASTARSPTRRVSGSALTGSPASPFSPGRPGLPRSPWDTEQVKVRGARPVRFRELVEGPHLPLWCSGAFPGTRGPSWGLRGQVHVSPRTPCRPPPLPAAALGSQAVAPAHRPPSKAACSWAGGSWGLGLTCQEQPGIWAPSARPPPSAEGPAPGAKRSGDTSGRAPPPPQGAATPRQPSAAPAASVSAPALSLHG